MSNFKKTIEDSFIGYAGAVLQNRALVDARDALKPSARQIFYCMETDKFIATKPFQKTLKSIGSAMRLYIHGDSSCEGIIMRAGQPFAMRYPLVEVEGSYGNLMESGNWAAPRYTAARLSPLAAYLFKDINKNTIEEWRDNYDDTEKYPAVLPSKGYYNLCNGTMGIGIGASSSIPSFNLREMNTALIKLLNNPAATFEDIYCPPDFATGGVILNEAEVKESLKNGSGAACKIRSIINYDKKENCLIVTEIPYSVYTNTICGQLEEIIIGENNPGIERFNDLTGEKPLIKIYLTKDANPTKVLEFLYKNTNLQYFYKINLTMLENGRFPRKFTFREALISYLNNQKIIYTRGFKYDLEKIENRLNIINGLLIAIADIDKVINIIKSSANKEQAKQKLILEYNFNEPQVKAILEMKLSRLTNLETVDLETEKGDLLKQAQKIKEILDNPILLNKEIEKDLREVMNKFGDNRRTKIQNVSSETQEIDDKEVTIIVDSNNYIKAIETKNLKLSSKGTKGSIINKDGVKVILTAKLIDSLVVADEIGNGDSFGVNLIPIVDNILDTGIPIKDLSDLESIVTMIKFEPKEYLITISQNGLVKKSKILEYKNFTKSQQFVKIKESDKLKTILLANSNENLLLLTKENKLINFSVEELKLSSKLTYGVRINDNIISCDVAAATDKILTCTLDGKGKFTYVKEFTVNSKTSLGSVVPEGTSFIKNITNSSIVGIEGTTAKTIFIESKEISHFSPKATGGKIYNGEISKIFAI